MSYVQDWMIEIHGNRSYTFDPSILTQQVLESIMIKLMGFYLFWNESFWVKENNNTW